MKKTTSLFLLVVIITLLFVGCNVQDEPSETNDDQNSSNTLISSNGVKVLDKYDDLIRSMELISRNGNLKQRYANQFTIKENVGEQYKVVYRCFQDHFSKIYYPIEFEEFFGNYADGQLVTRIYLLGESLDDCDHIPVTDTIPYDHSVGAFYVDPDYEKYLEYANYPLVDICSVEYVEIENKELISIREFDSYNMNGEHSYEVLYGETVILRLYSCMVIYDDMLDLIVDNLVPSRVQ